MTNEKDIGTELLRQDGSEPGKLADDERDKIRRILARDKARVKRLKWIVGICWPVVFVGYILYLALIAIMRSGGFTSQEPSVSMFVFMSIAVITLFLAALALITAVVCTISLFLRSRSVNRRELQMRMASIEEQLRIIAEKG